MLPRLEQGLVVFLRIEPRGAERQWSGRIQPQAGSNLIGRFARRLVDILYSVVDYDDLGPLHPAGRHNVLGHRG